MEIYEKVKPVGTDNVEPCFIHQQVLVYVEMDKIKGLFETKKVAVILTRYRMGITAGYYNYNVPSTMPLSLFPFSGHMNVVEIYCENNITITKVIYREDGIMVCFSNQGAIS